MTRPQEATRWWVRLRKQMASRQTWRKRLRESEPQHERSEEEDDDVECSVCFNATHLNDRRHFPCTSHWLCTSCYPRVNACPICRVGKDGSTQTARIERDSDPVLMILQWESMQDGSIQPRTQGRRIVRFAAGDESGGPMAASNLTVHAPGGLPRALQEVLPSLLARSLLHRPQRPRGEARADEEVVRVRSILGVFGHRDHA